MKKRNKNIILVIIILYILGYLLVRETHLIVHRSGYYSDSQGLLRTATHFVVTGDFGTPTLNLKFSLMQNIFSFIYIPIKFIEKLYWNIVVPIDSPWPYLNDKAKSNLSLHKNPDGSLLVAKITAGLVSQDVINSEIYM